MVAALNTISVILGLQLNILNCMLEVFDMCRLVKVNYKESSN